MAEGGSRRRSSAVRAVALFQKFKDYNEGGDGKIREPSDGTGGMPQQHIRLAEAKSKER